MLLTLREECRLRMFENGLLKRMLRPRREKVTGEWRNLHNEGLNDPYSSPTRIGCSNQGERYGWGMQHVWGRGEFHTVLWWGNLMKRGHLEVPGIELHLHFTYI
jgi:hypothetical protein